MLRALHHRARTSCVATIAAPSSVIGPSTSPCGARGLLERPGGDGSGNAASSTTVGVLDRMASKSDRAAEFDRIQAQRRAQLHKPAAPPRPGSPQRSGSPRKNSRAATTAPPIVPGARNANKQRAPQYGQQPKTAPSASQTGTSANAAGSPSGADSAEAAKLEQQQQFRKRLGALHTDYFETRKGSSKTLKAEAREKALLDERKERLTFRDPGWDLDKLVLRRDLFLWLSTWRRGGTENMTDQMLERELTYYPEHSVLELSNAPKLFHGTPTLMRGHPFPTLRSLTRLSAMSDVHKGAAPEHVPDVANPLLMKATGYGSRIGSGDDKGSVHVTRASFSRPTLVTLTPMAFTHDGERHDQQWVSMLRGEDSTSSAVVAKDGSYRGTRPLFNAQHFDVLRLKTIDMWSIDWLANPVMRAASRKLGSVEARETLVGRRVVSNFMDPFALRNFSATYCFLVDCRGQLRWMGTGAPSAAERAAFPALLGELEADYHRHQSKNSPRR